MFQVIRIFFGCRLSSADLNLFRFGFCVSGLCVLTIFGASPGLHSQRVGEFGSQGQSGLGQNHQGRGTRHAGVLHQCPGCLEEKDRSPWKTLTKNTQALQLLTHVPLVAHHVF